MSTSRFRLLRLMSVLKGMPHWTLFRGETQYVRDRGFEPLYLAAYAPKAYVSTVSPIAHTIIFLQRNKKSTSNLCGRDRIRTCIPLRVPVFKTGGQPLSDSSLYMFPGFSFNYESNCSFVYPEFFSKIGKRVISFLI